MNTYFQTNNKQHESSNTNPKNNSPSCYHNNNASSSSYQQQQTTNKSASNQMKGNFSVLCRIDLNRLSRIPPTSTPYDARHRNNNNNAKKSKLSSSNSNIYDNYLDEDLPMYRTNDLHPHHHHHRSSSLTPRELNDINNDKARPTSSLDRKIIASVPATDLPKSRIIKENEYLKASMTPTDFSNANGATIDESSSSKLFMQRTDVKIKSEMEKHNKRKYLDSVNSPKRENRKKKKVSELEVCYKKKFIQEIYS